MEESLGLVLAAASPLRDRSNEVETFKTPGKRRSRGGEERRRLSRDFEELEDGRRPALESEMMSFDEMRKQLSMWQTHLCELAAEQKEAEKLRQDTSSLRSKLSSCEAEASDRARRLVETRVQVQDKVRELADTHEQLNKKFIELAKEREVSDMLRRENGQMSVSMKEAERQFVAAQAEVASLKAEMTADKVQLTRVQARNTELEADSDQLRVRSQELEEELAQVSQASTEAARRLQVQEGKIEDLRSQCELHQAEVHQAREEYGSLAREAEAGLIAQKQMTALEQELETKRALALSMETELENERRKQRQLYEAVQVQKVALETEVADLRGALAREQNLSQTQKDELLNLRGEASMQQWQLKELQEAAAEAEQSCSELKTQHEAEVGSLRAQLHEVTVSAERQRYDAVQELQSQSIEVQRLLSVESTLQAALDGHCQQLAVRAQEQKDTEEQLLKLQKAHSQSLARQEEMEGERLTEAESHEAQEASLAALKLEIAEASSTLEATQQETLLWKQRAELLLGRRKAAMAVASRWHGADAAWDWLMEQGQGPQELQDLPEGTELRLQNRELCLSLRQFKQDCESLEAENLSLKEALACMEDDLHRVSDQHAQLVGHVNHRQKIRYTMKLKEEINRLHGDLKKARQRIVQLEVNKESDSLFEALASVVGGESYTTSKARRGSRLATSQRRGSVVATRPPRRGEVSSREDDQVRLAEAEQLCMLQQSALDRISMDFQHLKALIERAVQLADAERRHGVEGGNFAALLHRLREIIAANHRNPSSGGSTDDLGRLPVAATSITCDDDDEELAEGDTVCYGCPEPEQKDHAVEELG